MARRKAYTKLVKEGQIRPAYVKGMGDVVFRGFQCLNSDCQQFIIAKEDDIDVEFQIECCACGYIHASGAETTFFSYKLQNTDEDTIVQEGDFTVLHDDYLEEAQSYKHCILCYTLKPVEFFGNHAARRSFRQGECRLCKTIYNGLKNQTRTTDQHREASQRRRLYKRLSGEVGKINSQVVFEKFDEQCFSCEKPLQFVARGKSEFNLDHTLPAYFLWPLTTENATLLCSECNGEKREKWPSAYYQPPKLKALARLVGYPYDLLAGNAQVNPAAIEQIVNKPDQFIEDWIHYPDDLKKVRKMVFKYTAVDIFADAKHVPDHINESLQGDGDLT